MRNAGLLFSFLFVIPFYSPILGRAQQLWNALRILSSKLSTWEHESTCKNKVNVVTKGSFTHYKRNSWYGHSHRTAWQACLHDACDCQHITHFMNRKFRGTGIIQTTSFSFSMPAMFPSCTSEGCEYPISHQLNSALIVWSIPYKELLNRKY